MWLARLDLLAFAHFTDLRLRLSPGFHIIYGPNEAGKTTALRAIRQLLFGFDERTPDNFVHANANLRIGGQLRDRSGAELEVIRRKARKDPLRAADDTTIVDPASLQNMLCGIDESAFSNRYGIDYEQLVKGGREIASGTGDLGEILFATGSGVTDLTTIHKKLADEAAELFKPQGKKQRLNQAIVEWQEHRAAANDQLLLVSEWEDIDRRRQEVQTELDDILQELTLRTHERNLHRRMNQAWPLIRELDLVEQQLIPLASVNRLPEEFGSKRQEALLLLQQADRQERAAKQARETARQKLEAVDARTELLKYSEELTGLMAEWGSYCKAQLDRSGLVQQSQRIEQNRKQLIDKLGRLPDKVSKASTTIDRQRRTRIGQLGRQHAGLVEAVEQAESRSQQIETEIELVRGQLQKMPIAQFSEELRDCVRQARSHGDLETQLSAITDDLSTLRSDVSRQYKQLGIWTGEISDLKTLRTPPIDVIEECASAFDENQRELNLQKTRQSEAVQATEHCQRQIDELLKEASVPTEAELASARQARREIWDGIRKHLSCKTLPSATSIEEFERSSINADVIADRLRSEASRVALFAKQSSELAAHERRRNEISARIAELEAARATLDQRWQAEWADLHATADSPREMLIWISRRDALLRSEAQLSRRSDEADRLRKQINDHIEKLSRFLIAGASRDESPETSCRVKKAPRSIARATRSKTLVSSQQLSFGWEQNSSRRTEIIDSPNTDVADPELRTLVGLLTRAEQQIEREETIRQTRESVEDAASRLSRELAEVSARSQTAKTEVLRWQSEWKSALADLQMDSDLSPDTAADHMDCLNDLADIQRQVEQLNLRISAIDTDGVNFDAAVRKVCQRIATDLLEVDSNSAVATLRDRLLAAQKAQAIFNEQTARQENAEQQLAIALQLRLQAEKLISQLCPLAGIDYSIPNSDTARSSHLARILDQLAVAEEQSVQRAKLEDQRHRTESRLRELADATPMEQFLKQVREIAPENLGARLQEIETQHQRLADSRDQLHRQLGGLDEQLQQMDGNANAAEAEENQRQLLAQIRSDVEEYARIKLASVALARAVEQYRERIRGPVLKMAGDLFRDLTLGSFDGLRVDEDDQNRPILLGVRNDGSQTVTVEGMSEGTCDQLFLALRIASLMLESSPRNQLPFIVDDILIQFDDTRSAAALKVMSQLAQQRQVIFFTHHEHLLEIANRNLPSEFTAIRLSI